MRLFGVKAKLFLSLTHAYLAYLASSLVYFVEQNLPQPINNALVLARSNLKP